MPTSMKLAAIQGYALVAPVVAIKVGAVQGYALMRTPNLPDFTLAGRTVLLNAMNKQYKSVFTATQVTFGNPQPLTTDQDYNTNITLTTNRTSGYKDSKVMRYNRVDLALAIQGKDSAIPTTGMGATVWTSLVALNTKFGLALATTDVADRDVAGTGITIFASDTSVLFKPGTSMRLGTAIPSMTTVFSKVEMDNPLTFTAGLTARETLKALFLSTASAAGVGITVDDFLMEDPVVITGVKNTSVKLNTNNVAVVTGSQTLRYDRQALNSVADKFTAPINTTAATTVYGLLAQINAHTGLVFEARDFEDTAIGVGATQVTLKAASTSYIFIPGTTLVIQTYTNFPSLSDLITQPHLSGFTPAS